MELYTSQQAEELLKADPGVKRVLLERLRSGITPMETTPTGELPFMRVAAKPEATLFDVYGTLVISRSGDVGTAAPSGEEVAICIRVLSELGIKVNEVESTWIGQAYRNEILESHSRSREDGIDFPEVDIISVWHRVLLGLAEKMGRSIGMELGLIALLAVSYEAETNTTSLMPGAREVIQRISESDIHLGIISNAQFYTPLLLEVLLEGAPTSIGFSPDLLFWSYHCGRGKPSPYMFKSALTTLSDMGVTDPGKILYVGNDYKKDIVPTKSLDMQSALFAGDKRSLRLGDYSLDNDSPKPDALLTNLVQLMTLLED